MLLVVTNLNPDPPLRREFWLLQPLGRGARVFLLVIKFGPLAALQALDAFDRFQGLLCPALCRRAFFVLVRLVKDRGSGETRWYGPR